MNRYFIRCATTVWAQIRYQSILGCSRRCLRQYFGVPHAYKPWVVNKIHISKSYWFYILVIPGDASQGLQYKYNFCLTVVVRELWTRRTRRFHRPGTGNRVPCTGKRYGFYVKWQHISILRIEGKHRQLVNVWTTPHSLAAVRLVLFMHRSSWSGCQVA